MRNRSHCPVESAISLISGKWKPTILLQLRDGPKHFNELRRRLPQVTQRILTLQLRGLERDGIITRSTAGGNPPKIDYAISEKGMSLAPALHILEEWGDQHL